jgi:hypothetical protein
MTTKVCSMCKQAKPIEEFSLDKSKKDGHRSLCKACNMPVSARYRRSVKGVACEERRYRTVQKRIEEDEDFAQRRRDLVNASAARPEYKESIRRKARTKHGKVQKSATKAVECAILSGRIKVPSRCSRCGTKPGVDKLGRRKLRAIHIHGYEPEHHLDVEFMCPTCVNRLTKVERLT